MKTYERVLLIGLFLIMVSVFLPWHTFSAYFPVHGPSGSTSVETRITGTASGYQVTLGQVILAIAAASTAITFLPKQAGNEARWLTGQMFLGGLTAALFIIGGIAPVFTRDQVGPHIGLVGMLIGLVMTGRGLRQGMTREIKS